MTSRSVAGNIYLLNNGRKISFRQDGADMQITSFEEFKNWAAENIKSYLPDSYSEAGVEMRRVEKPGAPYTGLTVMKKGQTAAANVNLELMYEMYTGGASAEEIMESI